MIKKYKKKPVVIEAIQFTPETFAQCCGFVGNDVLGAEKGGAVTEILIRTYEGPLKAVPGDFIIKGVKGEFYPCKPDIFEMTYTEKLPKKRKQKEGV